MKTKKRVYEIARERGLETRQVMRRLQQAGVEVKAAASTVSDADIERVFGVKQESVSPASAQNLPSWLSPTSAQMPRTTTKTEISAEKEARTVKVDAAKNAKARAIEQAKRLRAKAVEKREQQAVEDQQAAEEAAATATAEAEAAAQAEVEAVVAATESGVEVEAELEQAEDGQATAETEEPVADEEADVVKEAHVVEEEVVEEAPDVPLTDLEQRQRAQKLAAQRVSEQAAKRRAAIEAERVTTESQAREKDKVKKKDKKKKGAAGETTEEFVGSRKPRVGGPSRESLTDADRGGRRGTGRKRRVVIDAQASRRGPAGGKSGPGKKSNRSDRVEEVVVDPTVPITIHLGAMVKELADALTISATEIIKILMGAGDFVTINQSLTREQIELVGIGLEPVREIIIRSAADDDEIPVFEDDEADLLPRAPVVTIMGHVDHGKTSLLDAIRETKVAAGEAGGITQHIGAYQVDMPDGRKVTFLDTPGHEAFTALRARGANVTDEVVLVVAADDGVKPQTLEAIDHARAANAPIVVAINKIDKENAQPEKVKAELAQHDLQAEEWGGKTVMVEVSAKQRLNLDELIEMILLQADVLELRANPNAQASGYIIESKLDPGRGPVATMLVQRGTLKVGDSIVAGASYGKVRALNDFFGKRAMEALPAMPIEIVGFNTVPDAGEFCLVVENDRDARERAQKKAQRLKSELNAKRQRGLTLDDLFSRIKEGDVHDLNLIVKGDVAGSIEAIEQELGKIEHPEVQVRIIHSGVGGITGNDVMLATASNAIILGFNVRPNAEARISAEKEGVDIRSYRVIYNLREDVENALSGLLSPEEVEETLGEAEIRQVFKASRIGTIAGCMVTQGSIERSAKVRLIRDGTVIHDGTISSLKRFKEDARDVAQGFECGISIDGYNDVKEGDIIEAYIIKHVERDINS